MKPPSFFFIFLIFIEYLSSELKLLEHWCRENMGEEIVFGRVMLRSVNAQV